MKNSLPPSSRPTFASAKTAGRDGQTAGGHRASGVFLHHWKMRKSAPTKGARPAHHSNTPRRAPSLDCPLWPACQCPEEAKCHDCPHSEDLLPIDIGFSQIEEPDTPPWWLSATFLVVSVFSIYWILRAAFYFGERLIGMVGV